MSRLFDERELSAWPEIPANPTLDQARECAEKLADWMRINLPAEVWRRIPKAVEIATGGFPDDLQTVLEWWNRLHDDGFVSHGVRDVTKPPKEIIEAWKLFQKNETAQECLADLDAVRAEIEKSAFCKKKWFRLEKLLRGSCNGGGVPIVRMLMDGAYRDQSGSDLLGTLRDYTSE